MPQAPDDGFIFIGSALLTHGPFEWITMNCCTRLLPYHIHLPTDMLVDMLVDMLGSADCVHLRDGLFLFLPPVLFRFLAKDNIPVLIQEQHLVRASCKTRNAGPCQL